MLFEYKHYYLTGDGLDICSLNININIWQVTASTYTEGPASGIQEVTLHADAISECVTGFQATQTTAHSITLLWKALDDNKKVDYYLLSYWSQNTVKSNEKHVIKQKDNKGFITYTG